MLRVGTALDCRDKKLRLPLRLVLKRPARPSLGLLWTHGRSQALPPPVLADPATLAWRNPRGLRYSVAMMALYLHFGEFRDYLASRIEDSIAAAEQAATVAEDVERPAVCAS